ncbi:SMP-30/gluconolactonase/LRE family protein [Haliea sp. E17]|uniref:SMP-30/gluconolactonase/LRE family protein n=1 Tax=Haliea sp. E17 TaxID=3401576 RepID=UPI003AB0AD7A
MTITNPAEPAFAADNHLGETPLWSGREQALYWVNCEQPPQVHRWYPGEDRHDSWDMPERVGGIALKASGGLLVVLSHGIYDFDPLSGSLELRLASPLPAHISLHETLVDRQGRLWVGAYDHQFTPDNRDAKGGFIFRLDGDVLTPVVPGISVANGLAVSPDNTVLYYADAPTRTAMACDLDPASGELGEPREFLRLQDGEGFVDGATVDAEGGYWLAAVGAGAMRRYLPDGSLDRVVKIPVSNPTKAAFGGAGLNTLYVTTTRLKIGPDAEANGGVYALDVGVRGLPEPEFRD